MGRTGNAESLANDDRAPRHGCLVHGGNRASAMTDGAALLGFRADQEPGDIDDIHYRQVEGFGEIDETRALMRRTGGPAAPRRNGKLGRETCRERGWTNV